MDSSQTMVPLLPSRMPTNTCLASRTHQTQIPGLREQQTVLRFSVTIFRRINRAPKDTGSDGHEGTGKERNGLGNLVGVGNGSSSMLCLLCHLFDVIGHRTCVSWHL